MSDDKNAKTSSQVIIQNLSNLSASVNELNGKINELSKVVNTMAELSRTQFSAISLRFDQLEAKVGALASGKKPTVTKKKEDVVATSPENVVKTYTSLTSYFKGEYSANRDLFRSHFPEEYLEDCDNAQKDSGKKGEALYKLEATYLYGKYVATKAGNSPTVVKIREIFKNMYENSKKTEETTTPSKKD